ncbi:hypothetical protein A5886_000080 [Enterococcus sp. 8G7_MSG3316]|uniref:histidine kinase n=1 Tax=Candidatus Enterococcus testudinis TaxID=1834191 RepID=A0A242A1X3_9ENTE|nr:histidine kinase [Enterococcus sp. 8G7_MSG3316]OTN75036.1 hypothetical protein A5886_000080 [Enterococcus sp. 8G7_MSG3316]
MLFKTKQLFKNVHFQKKIILISLLSSIIPLILLTIIGVFVIQFFIQQQEKSAYEDNVTSIRYQLETKINSYQDSLLFLANNASLIQELSKQRFSNYSQYDLYKNTVVPLFQSVTFQKNDIQKITLFTSLDLYDHGEYVKQINEESIVHLFDQQKTTDVRSYFDEDNQLLYFYTTIFLKGNSIDTQNFLVLTIEPSTLFTHLNAISNEPYDLLIYSESDHLVYQFERLTQQEARQSNQLIKPAALDTDPIILNNQWRVVFVKTAQTVFSSTFYLITAASVLFLIVLIFLIISSWWLAKTVVHPVNALTKQMASFSMEHLKIKDFYESTDEIGQLYTNFQQMLDQIHKLINEVYQAEIKQRKYELRALQAQINPHFFYNSLALISNTAMIHRQPEISEMAHLLSHFYRLSLNQGNSRLTVQKELALTITYAKIQQKMHHHSFDLQVSIDERTKEYDMINLLLQPFVENAIFHGIDHIEDDRRGVLTIRSYCSDHHLLFEVHDNGPGMSPEQLKSITEKTNTHYGIHNVCQRIALYYGVENALKITSSPENGTRVRLKLPFYLPKVPNDQFPK